MPPPITVPRAVNRLGSDEVTFFEDGLTRFNLVAIQAHESQGSEANGVIQQFNSSSTAQQQDILNFLRSL